MEMSTAGYGVRRGSLRGDFCDVIICTRNRANLLNRCLESVVPAAKAVGAKVIVVDNGSTDATASIIDGYDVQRVSEGRPGSSTARNTGIATSSANIIAFTDDDAIVEPDWLQNLLLPFEDEQVVGTGGRVIHEGPRCPDDSGKYRHLVELFDYGDSSFVFDLIGDWRLPIGVNMAVRRSALPAPAFDPRLGNRPGLSMACEEVLLFRHKFRNAYCVYVPSAVVHHRPETGRTTPAELRRACLHEGFGNARVLRLAEQELPHMWPRAKRLTRATLRYTRCRLQKVSMSDQLAAAQELGRSIDTLIGSYPELSNEVAKVLGRLMTR